VTSAHRYMPPRELNQPWSALVTQPRSPGASAETSRTAGIDLARLLDKAGYAGITSATLDLDPPAVCVQATVTTP
jgi:hypothetical protein